MLIAIPPPLFPLEAQNESGELYGFERAAALAASNPTVEQIVEAARAFE